MSFDSFPFLNILIKGNIKYLDLYNNEKKGI